MSFKSTFFSLSNRRIDDSVFALQVFNVVRFAAFFLVSVFLVKIPLNLGQIASYEYVLFLSSIVTGWWIHGFIQSFMADARHDHETDWDSLSANFRNYSRMLLLFGGSILLLTMGCIKLLAIWNILESPPSGFYYFLVFHFFLQAGVLLVYYFHQRRWTRYIYLASAYFFMVYVGSFLFLTGDINRLEDIYTLLCGVSIPVMVGWIYIYIKSKPTTSDDGTEKRVFPHLHYLLLIQAIGFISLWSDGFWVQYFYGTGDLFALFRYGGREFPLFVILTTTFATAMIQDAKQETGTHRIRQGSVRFIQIFFPVVIALLISSQWIYNWVYSEEFRPASLIFDVYLLLTLVRVLFPRPLLIAAGKLKALVHISAGELLINLILSLALYQVWGILGLILATLMAHFFELGASLYLVDQKLKIKMKDYFPVRLYLFFAFTITLILVVKYVYYTPQWMLLFTS